MRLSESRPKVDLIWVVDESGSMDDNREDLANNANMLFTYALASGLDFRVGVTNVCNPQGGHRTEVGKFCSEASVDQSHDGGVDRYACDDGDPCTKLDICKDGLCAGTYYGEKCADDFSCTQDLCDGQGGCLGHPLKAGWCQINTVCHMDGEPNPTGCSFCDADNSPSG